MTQRVKEAYTLHMKFVFPLMSMVTGEGYKENV